MDLVFCLIYSAFGLLYIFCNRRSNKTDTNDNNDIKDEKDGIKDENDVKDKKSDVKDDKDNIKENKVELIDSNPDKDDEFNIEKSVNTETNMIKNDQLYN